MEQAVAGKYLLEILSTGMYKNPLHIYREYIQNATDAIDIAVEMGVLKIEDAQITIDINPKKQIVSIRDNGTGIPEGKAQKVLLSVGASDKDPDIRRGFRGIGRLGGLGYAHNLYFVTSAYGEDTKTIMKCDCLRMKELLSRSNKETENIIETFFAISTIYNEKEEKDSHYFEVHMEGFSAGSTILLDENKVYDYLSEVAPVDFDAQKFNHSDMIVDYFKQHGFPILHYPILKSARKLTIFKPYSRSLSAGGIKRTRTNDYIKRVEFVYEETDDGDPLYIGWLAITDFSAQISDKKVQGIRLRKGNILIGDQNSFSKYFPSEGEVANKMFAGEIHVLHPDLVPNSQRDDFEPNDMYEVLSGKLTEWAMSLNKKYRRGTSEATSALRKLNQLNELQKEIQNKVDAGGITSDSVREKLAKEIDRIGKDRKKQETIVKKAIEKGSIDEEKIGSAAELLKESKKEEEKAASIATKILKADYATKSDLPSSYGREERKIYQRIIEVIDSYFCNTPETASSLREAIKRELSVKKK